MQLFREGYARSLSQERIAWAMEQNPLLIIIDTRKSPRGRRGFAKDDSFYVGSKPVKNGEKIPPNAELVQGLENQWGPDRYKYAGDYLGNRNYYIDGAPHDIVDMATGMKGMKGILQVCLLPKGALMSPEIVIAAGLANTFTV